MARSIQSPLVQSYLLPFIALYYTSSSFFFLSVCLLFFLSYFGRACCLFGLPRWPFIGRLLVTGSLFNCFSFFLHCCNSPSNSVELVHQFGRVEVDPVAGFNWTGDVTEPAPPPGVTWRGGANRTEERMEPMDRFCGLVGLFVCLFFLRLMWQRMD